MFRNIKIIILIAILVVSTIIVTANTIKTVPAGYKGVLLNWGEAVGALDEGLHFVIPIAQDIALMNTQIQKAESSESTASSDLQEVTTTVAVNYRIDASRAMEIYKNFRHDYEIRIINPSIEEAIKASTAKYIATELVTKRDQVKDTFLNVLRDKLEEYGIVVLTVSVTDFQFSRSFNEAIEAKVTAEQKALEAQNKLEQIKYEAQQQIIQAEAQANATVTRAMGDANATIIAANANAEAIRIIQVQLTPEYIEYLTVNGWNGELPIYWSGNGDMPFLIVPMNQTIP